MSDLGDDARDVFYYELWDGYAVLKGVDENAKEVKIIVSNQEGADNLMKVAEVISKHKFRTEPKMTQEAWAVVSVDSQAINHTWATEGLARRWVQSRPRPTEFTVIRIPPLPMEEK